MGRKRSRDPLIVDESVLAPMSGGPVVPNAQPGKYVRVSAFESKRVGDVVHVSRRVLAASQPDADMFWELEKWARGVLKDAEPDADYPLNSPEGRARVVLGSCHLARQFKADWQKSTRYTLRACEFYWKGRYGVELEPAAQTGIVYLESGPRRGGRYNKEDWRRWQEMADQVGARNPHLLLSAVAKIVSSKPKAARILDGGDVEQPSWETVRKRIVKTW